MGGTAPSRTDPGTAELCSMAFLERLLTGGLGRGPGEDMRGRGGVAALWGFISSGIGGVGTGCGFEDLRFSAGCQHCLIYCRGAVC